MSAAKEPKIDERRNDTRGQTRVNTVIYSILYTVFMADILNYETSVTKAYLGSVHPKLKNTYFFLLPVVRFIHLDCFRVSCLILEMVL